MINPTEKKRRGYIMHFEEGVYDALIHQEMNNEKTSSAYYRRGYEFGITLYLQMIKMKRRSLAP